MNDATTETAPWILINTFLCPACGHSYEVDQPPNFCSQCGGSHFIPVTGKKYLDADRPADQPQPAKVALQPLSAKVTDQPKPVAPANKIQPAASDPASWMGWHSRTIGHVKAAIAMTSLRDYVTNFQRELKTLRTAWIDQKKKSQELYESQIKEISAAVQDKKERNSNYRVLQSENSKAEEAQVRSIVQDCNAFADKILPGLNVARKRTLRQTSLVSERIDKIIELIRQEAALYDSLYQLSDADVAREVHEKTAQAQKERVARDTAADREYQEKKEQIIQARRADIAAGMNRSDVHSYEQDVQSKRLNASNYLCPADMPDYVALGRLNLIFNNEDLDTIDVIQAMNSQLDDHISETEQEYTIGIPYCQNISDGISLLIRHTGDSRDRAITLMQSVLLKLFMTIPAGKLEATLIDPAKIGASFADLAKIAELPSGKRIIDTKVWTKDYEIENAIKTFLQKMENLTQSYGHNMKSRLEKEALRVLAITDFPAQFSEEALRDLRAIVQNGASLGVFVIILTNDQQFEALRGRHGALVDAITRSLLDTKEEYGHLMLQNERYRKLYLSLDDMRDAWANKDRIIATIRDAIDHMQGKIERFDQMFDRDIKDSNNWFQGNHSEIAVPIGIMGANTVVRMVLSRSGGSIEHHALIAGQTGAGKSTLLHAIVFSTMMQYAPDEVQLYLVDFKEGIEFKTYTRYRLPSLRVIAVDSEREFGLNILKELCTELESRAALFSSARYGVKDINDYSKLPHKEKKVPRLLLIFDEVQELFRGDKEDDDISKECLSCLSRLVTQGRAMGIHIVLACNDFNQCPGLSELFSQMLVRIAVKSSAESAASILKSDNKGIQTLLNAPTGAAIYNGGGGVESANIVFQVGYMDQQERLELLSRFSEYFSDEVVAEQYSDLNTRVLLTNAEDDYYSCFNRLIAEGSAALLRPIALTKGACGLLLGFRFSRNPRFMTELDTGGRDNLLIVGKDEKRALSLFVFSALSALYEELHTAEDQNRVLLYIVNLSAGEANELYCDLPCLQGQFPDQIELCDQNDIEPLITKLYKQTADREAGRLPDNKRIYLLFFGINRARCLRTNRVYDDDGSGNPDLLTMLQNILERGPRHRIHSIVWSESLRSLANILGRQYGTLFDKRIAYGLAADDMDLLVAEGDADQLRNSTAVYIDVEHDNINTHFRPYNLPAKEWVEQFALACEALSSDRKEA